MTLIGAWLSRVEPSQGKQSRVEIELPFRAELTRQHGYATRALRVRSRIPQVPCQLFALPCESLNLMVEFKINVVAPATGERSLTVGRPPSGTYAHGLRP